MIREGDITFGFSFRDIKNRRCWARNGGNISNVSGGIDRVVLDCEAYFSRKNLLFQFGVPVIFHIVVSSSRQLSSYERPSKRNNKLGVINYESNGCMTDINKFHTVKKDQTKLCIYRQDTYNNYVESNKASTKEKKTN